MTDRLTDDEIAKLRTRIAEASPAPWHRCSASDGKCQCGLVWSIPEDHPVLTHYSEDESGGRSPTTDRDVANTHLAADMRNAIDRLLDELLEHRAREAEARADRESRETGGYVNAPRQPVLDVRMPMPTYPPLVDFKAVKP